MKPIQVMLVEDHALVRAGISGLLSSISGMEVMVEAGNGAEALRLINQAQPDVVLMDISLPGISGLETAEKVIRDFPAVRIIILSMHTGQAYVRQALRVGAAGYLLKDAPIAELEFAIRAVARGDLYLTPAVSKHAVSDDRQGGKQRESSNQLTPRQREIIQLIALGRTTQETAHLLGLSPKTVEAHRAQIMERLNIRDVPSLVRYAIKNEIISLDD